MHAIKQQPLSVLRKLILIAMTAHNNKILGEGLTYDDVLLVPAYSEVLPREVSIQTKFSRNIELNVPIVSAAMDGERCAEAAIKGL